jgi:hypothetical protein
MSLGRRGSSGRISGNATAGPSQPRRMPSPTGCTAERRAHYPAAGIGHRTPSGRMPCMGAFTGIHGRKRPHAIRQVGAWSPKAAFAMPAARQAHRRAQHAAARACIFIHRGRARRCALMPRTGSSVAGLTQDVAVPGWPAASRQPRTLLAGVVADKKPVAERNPYLRSSREAAAMRLVQRRLRAPKRAF